jgi:hypothetical protein
MTVFGGVPVVVTVPGRLERQEHRAGGQEQTAHDQVLMVLHRGSELESDPHDERPENEGERNVCCAREQRQPRHTCVRIAPGPGENGERRPVVGEDRVTEADSGRGEEQSGRGRHACTVTQHLHICEVDKMTAPAGSA